MDFVAIDFETANSNLNSACSIGLVAVRDLEIVKKEYYLIKPPTSYFSDKNISIHGITYEDVKDCEDFNGIWNKIKGYFDEIIIAHNAQFDMSVLKNLFDTYEIELPNFIYLDSINISNSFCKCGNGLSERAAYFDINLNKHHNALDDAITCANIVIKSIENCNVNSFLKFVLIHQNLSVKEFYNIKANKTIPGPKKPKYSNVKTSDIMASTSEFDNSHPLFDKNIVLTGELSIYGRKEAMQIIANLGGILKSGVSGKTNYLVVGTQDENLVGPDGMSSKERKAYELFNKGFDIKIINEDEFLNLISEKSHI